MEPSGSKDSYMHDLLEKELSSAIDRLYILEPWMTPEGKRALEDALVALWAIEFNDV